MRSTFTIDDELLEKAKDYSGIEGTKDVVHAALTQMIQREAGRRLAKLGGSQPDLKVP
ncbi:MAG TPA: type II toxin-antitoxin system VapB family antitoxin, partial [Aestuariivirga sp.]